MNLIEMVTRIVYSYDPSLATFDLLAEEVMELHLALRGKHPHTPAMEWLGIATIAMNALCGFPQCDIDTAFHAWSKKHGKEEL